MKFASWNVNSLRVRLPHVLDWLASAEPDMLGLQETKMTDDQFPHAEIAAAGYTVAFAGQKTYNGVAVLAKKTIAPELKDIVTDIPGLNDPQRRVLAATVGDTRFINLYVPNGSEVGSEKYAYKLDWLQHLHDWVKDELQQHQKVVVVGDFNIAPADADVYDPDTWQDKILCSAPERQAYQDLLALGLSDSFRQFEQEAASFSWWDYRAAGFRRNLGLRIDFVLLSETLAKRCTASAIDKAPRRLERPSDHAPAWATID